MDLDSRREATKWIESTWEGSKDNNDELCLSQPLPSHLAID